MVESLTPGRVQPLCSNSAVAGRDVEDNQSFSIPGECANLRGVVTYSSEKENLPPTWSFFFLDMLFPNVLSFSVHR